jgi:hypothetical protein
MMMMIIIIIKLPDQAIASTPSAIGPICGKIMMMASQASCLLLALAGGTDESNICVLHPVLNQLCCFCVSGLMPPAVHS